MILAVTGEIRGTTGNRACGLMPSYEASGWLGDPEMVEAGCEMARRGTDIGASKVHPDGGSRSITRYSHHTAVKDID